MARQNGILKLEGTIGDITFYKSQDGHLAKAKGGVSKDRILTDPKFIRTRENGAEFGSAGLSGKLLRDNIRPLMAQAADNRVTSRITKLMTQILKLDATSARGKRNVGVATAGAPAKALLKNFNFNLNAILGGILFKPFAVNTATGVITIASLTPANDIAFPAGATHVNITGGAANINFATGAVDVKPTNAVNLAIAAAAGAVTLTPTAVPAGTGMKMFFLKIEFLQLVNGIQYSLKNGAFNALAVVEVA
jgi:hypothetical protein